MDAHAKLDHALATLSAPERERVLRELLAGMEATLPGAGSAAFDRARRGLPPRRLIAPAPAAVLSRVSKDILLQVAQLHHQAGAGVRELQQGGKAASASVLPTAPALAPPAVPAVRHATRRRSLRVLFFAALLWSPVWLIIAQAGVWWTLEQRLREVQPQADAAQQAETQRADLARQVESLRQQIDGQTAERKRLQGLAEQLNQVQAQRTAEQAALATLNQQQTDLQAKLDPLRRRFSLTFVGTRAGQERDDNGLRMKLCWCPAGSFTMGSPPSEPNRDDDENQVSVTLSQGFWLGKYEVTQADWQALMGSNPSYFSSTGGGSSGVQGITTTRFPVETVSWNEASEFCRKLTQQEHQVVRLPADWEYRLPTEAQWEYACRAGTVTATAFGDKLSSRQANFDGDYPYNEAEKGPDLTRTAEVGSYAANAWGLHDMHGKHYYHKLTLCCQAA